MIKKPVSMQEKMAQLAKKEEKRIKALERARAKRVGNTALVTKQIDKIANA